MENFSAPNSPIALLSLIIALSAYVSGVRLAVIGRINKDNKAALKKFLRWLLTADIPLAVSGSLLFLKIFWADLFGGSAPNWLAPTIVWTFFVGVFALACHHIALWIKGLTA